MASTRPSFLEELSQSASGFGFDLAPSLQVTAGGDQDGNDRARPQVQKRSRYITRACQDCQRRKVKCSGEAVCHHCRQRNVPCVYAARPDGDGSRKRGRASSRTHAASNSMAETCDSRMVETDLLIEERVAQLREQVRRASDASVRNEGRWPLRSSSSALYTLDVPTETGEETDTFDSPTGATNLSLAAQLSDLQRLFRIRGGLPSQPARLSGPGRSFPLELPTPSTVRHLLEVYFQQQGSFFPFIDQRETEPQILQTLKALGHSQFNLIIDVDSNRYPIIALLCNMLTMGECMDPEVQNCDDSRPGWAMYQRGKRLMQHCGSSRAVDADLIRYHTLSALYMMNCELLQSAALAIATAVQLAMVAKLNDQSSWGECSPEERKARQRLWWTLYFLDRRISQRNGTPYLIRDSEIAVEEFDSSQDRDRFGARPVDEGEDTQSRFDTDSYFQSLVDFGKLWGQIWDTFYAASVPKGCNWKEIVLTDTRLLIFRRQLPPELAWDTEKVEQYITNGETEPTIRRRLAIFIRTNLLRMILRQNPTLSCDGDNEARQFCAGLARSSIDAIAAFAKACPRIRASGYFISTALVECIYHLVFILQDRGAVALDRTALLDAFIKAYQLLTEFASAWITAKRALQALSKALFSHGDASTLFAAISKPPSEPSEKANESPQGDIFDFLEGYPAALHDEGEIVTDRSLEALLNHVGSSPSRELSQSMPLGYLQTNEDYVSFGLEWPPILLPLTGDK